MLESGVERISKEAGVKLKQDVGAGGEGERKEGCPKGEENSVSYLGLGLSPGAVGQGIGEGEQSLRCGGSC